MILRGHEQTSMASYPSKQISARYQITLNKFLGFHSNLNKFLGVSYLSKQISGGYQTPREQLLNLNKTKFENNLGCVSVWFTKRRPKISCYCPFKILSIVKKTLKNCDCGIAELRLRSNVSLKSCGIAIVIRSSCGIAIADSKKSCACPPLHRT
jgi:hypothetical protein